jgi:MFS family permease
VAGYTGYGLFYWLIGQLQAGGPWLVPLFASYGLFLSATEGVEKAMVADLSPAGQRGTAFGWFNLTTGLMVLPASMIFGWLYERFGSELAFTTGGICALAAALWLARLDLRTASSTSSR